MKRPKMGRPTKPRGQRKDRILGVRLTDREHQVISGKASLIGQKPSVYLRDLGLREKASA